MHRVTDSKGNVYVREVIKSLYRFKNDRYMYELAIVEWSTNGKKDGPTLEHRQLYEDHHGKEQLGKVKGLTPQDIYRILEQIHEVSKIMDCPIPLIAYTTMEDEK